MNRPLLLLLIAAITLMNPPALAKDQAVAESPAVEGEGRASAHSGAIEAN